MFWLPVALLTVFGARGASAQIDVNITCIPSFHWADNSLSQNPCVVAAWLQAECNEGSWEIDPLPKGYHYIGPTNDTDTQNPCTCSTPVYQLLSACGACQNETFISWSSWSFYCPASITPSQGVFPAVIPAQTRVPAWAYIKPSAENDWFNITLAKNLGDSPESSQVVSSTTSSTTSTTSSTVYTTSTTTSTNNGVLTVTVTSSSSATPPPTSSPSGGSKSSNVGAIVGGVVGGVVGLGLIALLGVYLLHTKKNEQDTGEKRTSVATAQPQSPLYPQSQYTGQTAVSGGGYYNPAAQPRFGPNNPTGQYSGVPEV